jgi:hypothetical protein
MKTQIIALEAHDDFISVRDRMSWAKSPRILLVWPKYEKITLRAADLRILQQHAVTLGAEMGVITRRGDVRRDAQRFGIPVFGSAAAAQREAWSPRQRPAQPSVPRKPRERQELEAMRQAARPGEAGWRGRPLTRLVAFVFGVAAVLVMAGLFLPKANITVAPISQQQSISIPLAASSSVQAVSIAGTVPAHAITVTVSASQAAKIATQSSIPDHHAQGIARFTNLSQSDLVIPRGTIIYSLSPVAARFATQNDTHLPGNVNAVVEVPILALEGGGQANLPANAIDAIEGTLGLSAAVTNPKPTDGGTDRVTAAPSEADRQRLHDVLLDVLKTQAENQMRESIGSKDLLLIATLKQGQAADEIYDPPAGKPGNLLKLTLRTDFSAEYVKADDITQLAAAVLDGAKPTGYMPVDSSLSFQVVGTPTLDDAGVIHCQIQISRKITRQVDAEQANALVRGLTPWAAANVLQARLPLATRPEIRLSPSWWPWLPLVPFRITVVTG